MSKNKSFTIDSDTPINYKIHVLNDRKIIKNGHFRNNSKTDTTLRFSPSYKISHYTNSIKNNGGSNTDQSDPLIDCFKVFEDQLRQVQKKEEAQNVSPWSPSKIYNSNLNSGNISHQSNEAIALDVKKDPYKDFYKTVRSRIETGNKMKRLITLKYNLENKEINSTFRKTPKSGTQNKKDESKFLKISGQFLDNMLSKVKNNK